MSGRGPAVALGPPRPEVPPCSWCGLRKSIGLYQGSECCRECKDGGPRFRRVAAMARWKRGRGES